MAKNSEAYSKIDNETKDMLEIVANVKIPEKFKTVEDGKERYDMCKAFEDMRQEGIEEGIEEGCDNLSLMQKSLLDAGKTEELQHVILDKTYREKMYREYFPESE